MLKRFFSRLLDVQATDPDDSRRGKILNIILLGLFACALLGLIFVLVMLAIDKNTFSQLTNLIGACVVFIIFPALIYLLNRKFGRFAASLFVFLLTIALTFIDTPANVLAGRSLFVFAIPITIASLIIHPLASFLFSGLTAIIMISLSIVNHRQVEVPAILGYTMLGLIAWLSSRSLEQALTELRQVNANLDRIVQERTKELADALSRERAEAGRSKAILESIADGVVVFDIGGVATVANPSSVRLLEIPVEEIAGSTIDDISQSKALDPRNRGLLAGLLANPSQQLMSYRIQWAKKTLSVTSAGVTDTNGERIGTVAVFRDYTREAEVDRMKNTFLAIVSHELRTPLNAIIGYAEMLKEAVYGAVNEKQAKAAERIMTNSHRLLDIVSDLLDQAQIEAGKLTIHMRPFRPVELLENVHGVMDKIAADKNLTLTSELDPELPDSLNGDMARLQQILVNLVNNSIKFTDTGSIHINLARTDKRHWKLEVMDTGIGIPEEELSTVFEAFRQVDSTATRKHGGFGLGLTIVKQLAELMGGEVAVKSKLDVGSIFTVTLPLIPTKRKPE